MKALFVRFIANPSVGSAIVIPDADNLTIFIGQRKRIVMTHAKGKMVGMKILKEFEIDFFTLDMLITHKAQSEQLQGIKNSHESNESRLLHHLRDTYTISFE